MRILYVSTGSGAHDAKILRELKKRGYDVHYAPLAPVWRPVTVDHFKTTNLGYDDSVQGSRLHRLFSFALSYARSYLNLRRLLRGYHPDILHATFIQTAGLISAATGFHPLLLSPWGSDVLRYPRDSVVMRVLTMYAVSMSDAVFCDSEAVRGTLGRLTGNRIDNVPVIPWGVSLDLFRQDHQARLATRRELGWEDCRVIIMTRSFYSIYGVAYFLESLPAVFETEPAARALLIGKGPLEHDLHQLVQKLGIRDKVRFLGEIPNAEMPRYLNSADIYVSSSLSDSTSVSLLEALACGLPVVVTDVAANLEWIKDGVNGLVVPQQDTRRLGEAILSLMRDERGRREMSLRNIAKAGERANWDRNFSEVEELYRKLAAKPQHQ